MVLVLFVAESVDRVEPGDPESVARHGSDRDRERDQSGHDERARAERDSRVESVRLNRTRHITAKPAPD